MSANRPIAILFDYYVIRRRQNRFERQRNRQRIYNRRNQLNNGNALLNQITTLPQQTSNDPLINHLFNGTPFI